VEAGRIELPSEIESRETSTCIVKRILLTHNCPIDTAIMGKVC